MTIEEKAKAYDEALEKAKNALQTDLHESGVWAIRRIFPELKESEDERIRKKLIEFLDELWHLGKNTNFDRWGKADCADWISYLEKQKEQRSEINIEHLKSYMLQYLQDASNREDDSEIEADTDKWARMIIKVFGGIKQKPVHTAKEMWKEMRLEVYAQASGNRHEPNYSDDSTKMFSLCDIDEIFEKIGNSTVGSQPAEWSEEDKAFLKVAIAICNRYSHKDIADWLKSLRPQPHTVSIKNATKFGNLEYERGVKDGIQNEKNRQWKPSKEQMEALNEVINTFAVSKHPHENDYLFNILNGLRKNLKSL